MTFDCKQSKTIVSFQVEKKWQQNTCRVCVFCTSKSFLLLKKGIRQKAIIYCTISKNDNIEFYATSPLSNNLYVVGVALLYDSILINSILPSIGSFSSFQLYYIVRLPTLIIEQCYLEQIHGWNIIHRMMYDHMIIWMCHFKFDEKKMSFMSFSWLGRFSIWHSFFK